MDREALLALAERVEKSTGPDRELEGLIWAHRKGDEPVIVGNKPGRFPQEPIYGVAADVMRAFPNKDGADYIGAPAYMSSLDAAMTLVPEGYDWAVFRTNGGLTIHAWCGDRTEHFGATPAAALTAASLRALANQESHNG